jgi:hypothetical protein
MRAWVMTSFVSGGILAAGASLAACSNTDFCANDFCNAGDAAADGGAALDGASGDAPDDQSSSFDGGSDGARDGGAVACDGGSAIMCSGQCVDPKDPAHCGSSCTVCTSPSNGHATCDGTNCAVACNASYHACNGQCLADSNDPSADACVISETFGVFVAPTGSDAAGCGTKASPCKTIGKGLTVAHAASKRTYVCEGTYDEKLVIDASLAGARAFGGFACATWAYDATKKPKVAPSATGYAMVVDSVTGATFEDFAFESKSAVNAGESSIALFAKNATGVVLRRCSVQAGAGMSGQDQTPPAPFASAAPSGNAGGISNGGGVAQNSTCTTSTGGAGGQPATSGQDGTDGAPGPSNKGTIVACQNSTGGLGGAVGGAGAGGTGASMWASFTPSGWTPSSGGAGGQGGVGQGGGGGASIDLTGGAGSGGAGGCGGIGGATGTGGGSSIAVLAYSSSVDTETCTLTAGSAGRGGNGASGQTGQAGGTKGNGFGNACSGGRGGAGGAGGGGGGGAGGVSAGIVWAGAAPTVNGTTTPSAVTLAGVTLGTAGTGGAGANVGRAGAAGAVVQFQ